MASPQRAGHPLFVSDITIKVKVLLFLPWFSYFDSRNTGRLIVASKNFAEFVNPLDGKKVGRIGSGSRYFETVKLPGRRAPFRVLSIRISVDEKFDYIIQIGTTRRRMRKTLGNFKRNLLTAIPIVLVLGAVGGWFLARRSLAPISHITETAHRITVSNLGERLKPKGSGDELDQLIATMNDMLSRLEDSFKRISQFTGNVSHELRTPISSMRGEADLLLSKPRPIGEYQRVLAHHGKIEVKSELVKEAEFIVSLPVVTDKWA